MHLGVNKVADIVSSIWPFKFTEALNLTVFKVTSVYEKLALHVISGSPFFVSLPIYNSSFEITANFKHIAIYLLHTLTLHFIFHPSSFEFNLDLWLFVFTVTAEKTVFKFTYITTTIFEYFAALAIRIIICELTFIHTSISVVQSSLSFINTISPLPFIKCAILPPAHSETTHFYIHAFITARQGLFLTPLSLRHAFNPLQ